MFELELTAKGILQPTDLDVVNELEEGEDEDLRLGLAAPERRVDVVQLKWAAFLGLERNYDC